MALTRSTRYLLNQAALAEHITRTFKQLHTCKYHTIGAAQLAVTRHAHGVKHSDDIYSVTMHKLTMANGVSIIRRLP
jgi:2-methylcitrate dehydratase PrpD